MKYRLALALVAAQFVASPVANAGVMEELLALPAIQSLLGRLPDVQATLQRCADVRYKQRNAGLCQQAESASRLAKMPLELRAVLAVPAASASIRELCLAVQSGPTQNSYLCAELAKADLGFKTQLDQTRQANEAVELQRRQRAGGGAALQPESNN